jgi:lipopolysaccharide/colanic/teichoic acid biosynthesis glycosyltransferase
MPAEPGAGGAAKRALDLLGAGLGLAVLSPVVLAVAAAVRVKLGGPVLFRQERVGLGGRSFTIYKFRTMRHGPGSDAERLTRFGRFLRSTSLDELPQLWNVLRGDMSLVGPRPLLPEYLPRYSPRQALRPSRPTRRRCRYSPGRWSPTCGSSASASPPPRSATGRS